MVRITIIITLVAVLLSDCSGLAAPCTQQAATFIAQVGPLAREWDDLNTLASKTPRMALSAQIKNLQDTRRKTQDLKPPDCAAEAHQHLIGAMDATITGYLDFLAQRGDTTAKLSFDRAGQELKAYRAAMAVLRGDPTPTP